MTLGLARRNSVQRVSVPVGNRPRPMREVLEKHLSLRPITVDPRRQAQVKANTENSKKIVQKSPELGTGKRRVPGDRSCILRVRTI
jgi:hypothetical protein